MNASDRFRIKIIQFLYGRKQRSISEISKAINKSIPFVTTLINDMIDEGLIIEDGLADSSGGRRPQLYTLKSDAYCVVAVAVNQVNSIFAIYDLVGQVIFGPIEIENHLNKDGSDLERLADFINENIKKSKVPEEKILGVGIGMPGFINVDKGINHSFLFRKGESITDYLESQIGLPVNIDNDSSLIGLAELRLGQTKGHSTTLVVNIGWGVGLGILINEEMYRGETGYAGEFSHIPLYQNEIVCSCGKMGCLETETSLHVLYRKTEQGLNNNAMTTLPDKLPEEKKEAIEIIFDRMQQGDSFSLNILKEVGYELGRGISILIHLFNPGLVILAGQGSKLGKLWIAPVQQGINETSIPKLSEYTEVVTSSLGPNSQLLGASALVIEKMKNLTTTNQKKSDVDKGKNKVAL